MSLAFALNTGDGMDLMAENGVLPDSAMKVVWRRLTTNNKNNPARVVARRRDKCFAITTGVRQRRCSSHLTILSAATEA